jgi:transcriptional regulator with XRE-family HTH domain
MNEIDIFWARVKRLIKNKKTTQEEVAKACGIHLRTLEGWMYKGIYPTISDAYLLARTLGVSMEYLLTGKDKHETEINSRLKIIHSLLGKFSQRLDKIMT